MNIGINGYEAVVPRFGYDKKTGLPNRVGSGEFSFQLLKSLFDLDKKNNYFIYLPISPSSDLPQETSNWHYVVFSSKKLWTLIGLSKKLFNNKNNLDVFFSPTHYSPFTFLCPSVVAILDVSYLHFPNMFNRRDLYQLKLWGRYSISKAKKIITISESSKSDIIKKYKVSSSEVAVVYPGTKPEMSLESNMNIEDLKQKFGISNKYILFVGTLQPRKNIVRLIEAFSKVVQNYSSSERSESRSQFSTSSNNKGLDLVIVGKKGWMFDDILNAPKKFDIADRVRFLHEVTDGDLPSFYKNAVMFVLPSLYEGFGLPVLEAMKYGCPVITSNISSLPEAGGDAALYVDPNNTDDIASKMRKLLEDENLRKELIAKGKKQIEKFSWEKSAKETLAVLESL